MDQIFDNLEIKEGSSLEKPSLEDTKDHLIHTKEKITPK